MESTKISVDFIATNALNKTCIKVSMSQTGAHISNKPTGSFTIEMRVSSNM